MGAQHYVGRSRTKAPFTACVSTSDHYVPMRALIIALDNWTSRGAEPPSSAYPRLADGSLTTVDQYRAAFPAGIGLHRRSRTCASRASSATAFRRAHGPDYETRVPAPDADGNDRGGVRLVELQAPLGTYTGWNLRAPETGFAWATSRFDGSFVPFARTEAERLAGNDPRPSLESRYPTRDDFVAAVRAAAERQMAAGLLLPEDLERTMQRNVGLYDRIQQRDPSDAGCAYLFAP
ncbi:alpha/beta hydrolase domain-containing protein [Pseudoduganella sp. UC29_106]|uniref:alpha/beta hydrolase domain-containing protein n=1 Tax=Pseudoduganella sp. UC29_106 TaxID=3374553 RepID=UPI0037565F9B